MTLLLLVMFGMLVLVASLRRGKGWQKGFDVQETWKEIKRTK